MTKRTKAYTVKDIIGAIDATEAYVKAIRKLLGGLPPSTKLTRGRGAVGRSAFPKIRIQRTCPPPK